MNNTNAYLILLGNTFQTNAGWMTFWNGVQQKTPIPGYPNAFLITVSQDLEQLYKSVGSSNSGIMIFPIDLDEVRDVRDNVDLPHVLTQFLGSFKSQAA